jgi:hypothetical protein
MIKLAVWVIFLILAVVLSTMWSREKVENKKSWYVVGAGVCWFVAIILTASIITVGY